VAVHDTGVRGPPIEILWISFFGATLKNRSPIATEEQLRGRVQEAFATIRYS
jgi:hypothetical protein